MTRFVLVKEHLLKFELWLPRPLDEVFEFFIDARNLGVITPEWVNFEILTPTPIEMRVGALIDYRIRVRGLPLPWRTLIREWNPPRSFVDEQIRGPYRRWHHTHTFAAKDGGTLCGDEVRYAVWGGALVNRLFVRRDVERIFAFREAALRKRFSQPYRPAPSRWPTPESSPA